MLTVHCFTASIAGMLAFCAKNAAANSGFSFKSTKGDELLAHLAGLSANETANANPIACALAHNLANLLPTQALPETVAHLSLTSLREKLVEIGARIVTHALRGLPNGGSRRVKGIVWSDSKLDRRTAAKTVPGAENGDAKWTTTMEQCVQVSGKSSKINNSANPQHAEHASRVENGAWSCCAGRKFGIFLIEPASSGECRMIYVQNLSAVIGEREGLHAAA